MKSHRTEQGMTLIEVLVALAVLSMLSLGVFATFNFAQRRYGQSLTMAERTEEVSSAQRFLRRVLEAAYPFQPASAPPLHYGLEGSGDSVTVSAPAGGSEAHSGLYRYRIFVQRTDTGSDLHVHWIVDRNGRNDSSSTFGASSAGSDELLVRNIDSLQWSYASAEISPSGARTIHWGPSWTGEVSPPVLVRLDIKFPVGDRRSWPTLIVAPSVTDDAQCEFDVVSQGCRRHST
jgi:general secretion pathway protein J